ncbi:MAG: hypothetical protein UR61_C0051G0004 [candidate division WS6 bacterium GW2011_GWE1_34_7]|uniref:Yip1 domain-containing protein n=2 Tax=Candidatus Dojkabacteria TaxID=74243 RepID=A0A0G0BKQ0_9BACT|nr:MAG: hypothetical protein UR61_C0051G0004 [candidate division WS6 bacterium GW2011_GWE1_34_7]KKP77847.1 MAG: hypothetical protein UR73_C0009G0007 [candidate division WS6 bacterium GW2011_GWF1_35_23]
MRRFISGAILSLLLLLPLVGVATPVLAQTEEDSVIAPFEGYDWETEYDWDDLADEYDYSDLTEASVGAGILATLFGGAMLFVSIICSLGMYIFMSLTLMKTADKLGAENTWYAWIPILNGILLFKLGDQNPWLLLLALIPGIGALILGIFAIIATMKICEKRGYDKLLGLLMLVPIASLILWGMLAWGKKSA